MARLLLLILIIIQSSIFAYSPSPHGRGNLLRAQSAIQGSLLPKGEGTPELSAVPVLGYYLPSVSASGYGNFRMQARQGGLAGERDRVRGSSPKRSSGFGIIPE